MNQIYIIFDGPPSHDSGRFVEVEDGEGNGLGWRETGAAWSRDGDDLWKLGPFLPSNASLVEPSILAALEEIQCGEAVTRAKAHDALMATLDELMKKNLELRDVKGRYDKLVEAEAGRAKSEVNLSPLLSEISALRLEMRATAMLTLASTADSHASKDDYLEQGYQLQGRADQVAKGGK